jgi:hypothetical protein
MMPAHPVGTTSKSSNCGTEDTCGARHLSGLERYTTTAGLSGKGYHRSLKASGREDLQVEEPVACGDCASFHFHPAEASVLGAPLIGGK